MALVPMALISIVGVGVPLLPPSAILVTPMQRMQTPARTPIKMAVLFRVVGLESDLMRSAITRNGKAIKLINPLRHPELFVELSVDLWIDGGRGAVFLGMDAELAAE